MNERIKQLLNEATSGHEQEYDTLKWMTVSDKEMKKFAELIVRECVGILMTPEYPMNHPEELADYNRGWVNGRLLGIEYIREHFEVEQ
jgi:hypothetical protein